MIDAEESLVGVITEEDVVGLLTASLDVSGTAADYVTHEAVTFDEDDDVIAVCESLVHNHFRRVPIFSQGRLIGIISRGDLIKPIGSGS